MNARMRWARLGGLLLISFGGWAGSLAAQERAAPQCRLSYRGNFRLNSAQQYISRAINTTFMDEKPRLIADALRVLGDAAATRDSLNLTTWHLLGQAYVLVNNLAAADSAFTRAERLADEECRREIALRRRAEWVPLQNAGVAQMREGNADSAMALFRLAGVIYRGEPHAFVNLASLAASRNQVDTALVYYRRAMEAAADPQFRENREAAAFNIAVLLHRAERYQEAAEAYREYLRLKPNDVAAASNYADVLTRLGRTADAGVIYDSLLLRAEELPALDLFEAGVALFRQERYGQAARAFELGLAKSPFHRDALYNLVNTYIAGEDSAHLVAAARRLVAVDPANRQSVQLLAAAYQRVGMRDSTVRVLTYRDAMRFDVGITQFQRTDSSATVTGTVTNLKDQPLAALALTFDFLSASGEALRRRVVNVPPLRPSESHRFTIEVSGAGIAAWRYRVD